MKLYKETVYSEDRLWKMIPNHLRRYLFHPPVAPKYLRQVTETLMKTPFKDINHEEAYPRILTYSESVYFKLIFN